MGSQRKALYRLLRVLAAAAWLAIIIFAFLHRKEFTIERVLSYSPENPLFAVLVLMLLFALKSLSVFFYSGILYAASGVLFPIPAAVAVNVCGTLVMSLISYSLARGLGAAYADELRAKYPKLREFDEMRSKNNFAFVVVLRCINIVNFDIGSIYCGAARLPLAPFLLGSMLGKAVDIIMYSTLGTSLLNRDPVPFLAALAADLSIAAAVAYHAKKHNFKEKKQNE